MSIKIDENLCIGCGSCAAVCAKGFKLNEEKMKAEVIDEKADCVKEAAEVCPVDAITIE